MNPAHGEILQGRVDPALFRLVSLVVVTRWGLVAAMLWVPPVCLVLGQTMAADLPLLAFAAIQSALISLALLYSSFNWRTFAVHRAQTVWLVFLLWLAIATLIAIFRFRELASVPMLTPYISFVLWTSPVFVIPALMRSDADLRALGRGLDFVGLLVAISVLLPFFGLDVGEVQVSESQGLRRVFGPIGDSVALLLSFFVVDAIARRRYARLIPYLGALLATVGLAAIMVTLVALGLMSLLAIRRGELRIRQSDLWKLAVAVPVIAGVVALTMAGIVARLQSTTALAFTLASRLGSYQSAWKVFVDNWLIGVGYTGLKAVVYRYEPETIFELFSENVASTAQNQLLQTATDSGLIGVLLAVAFAATCCVTMYRAAYGSQATDRRFLGPACWGIALCVANQSGVWLLPNLLVPYLFCVLVGMSCVQAQLDDAERPGAREQPLESGHLPPTARFE